MRPTGQLGAGASGESWPMTHGGDIVLGVVGSSGCMVLGSYNYRVFLVHEVDEYVFGIVWVHTKAGSMELFWDGMGGSIVVKYGYARYWQSKKTWKRFNICRRTTLNHKCTRCFV